MGDFEIVVFTNEDYLIFRKEFKAGENVSDVIAEQTLRNPKVFGIGTESISSFVNSLLDFGYYRGSNRILLNEIF